MKCWIELYDQDGALLERLTCTNPLSAVSTLSAYVERNTVFDFVNASCWIMQGTKPHEQWAMEIM